MKRTHSALLLSAICLLAFAGPWIPVGSPAAPVGSAWEPPTAAHPLGTDVLGRDLLARVAHGGRALVVQASVATLVGSVLGALLGGLAGLARGGHRVRWVADAASCFPGLMLMLLLAAISPGSDVVVCLSIVAVSLPFTVRVLYAATRQVADSGYVLTAHARGDSGWDILRFDLWPNLRGTLATEAGVRFLAAIQLAATAGFLGLGRPAPAAHWGRMIRENLPGIPLSPVATVAPALLLIVLSLATVAAFEPGRRP